MELTHIFKQNPKYHLFPSYFRFVCRVTIKFFFCVTMTTFFYSYLKQKSNNIYNKFSCTFRVGYDADE